MLRKLSTKTIMAECEVNGYAKFATGETKKFLYSMAGVATGVKRGETSFGPWIGFTGEFFAVVPGHEEPLMSYRAFVPEPFESMLSAALANADQKGIEFAVNIFIRPPTDTETVKYVYIVEPVQKIQESSKAKHLLSVVRESQKNLAKQLPDQTNKKK